MPHYAMTVNGAHVTLTLGDGDEPLLYVLRNRLGLTAARFGCGQGLCGACTILVDGRAVRSCDVPTWWANDRTIVTAEAPDAFAPLLGQVRDALAAEEAGQCGYCLSGIAMALTALLMEKPSPSREEIDQALERNLCRCGAHVRILRAVARVVAETSAPAPAGA